MVRDGKGRYMNEYRREHRIHSTFMAEPSRSMDRRARRACDRRLSKHPLPESTHTAEMKRRGRVSDTLRARARGTARSIGSALRQLSVAPARPRRTRSPDSACVASPPPPTPHPIVLWLLVVAWLRYDSGGCTCAPPSRGGGGAGHGVDAGGRLTTTRGRAPLRVHAPSLLDAVASGSNLYRCCRLLF